MDKNITTIGIQKREYAMELIKLGFEILNVLPSKQDKGGLAYIFEKTDDLMRDFLTLVKENKYAKQFMGLTIYDIRMIQNMLTGYELSETERNKLLNKLNHIDNQITSDFEKVDEQLNLTENIIN